jgi:hypothetical protein
VTPTLWFLVAVAVLLVIAGVVDLIDRRRGRRARGASDISASVRERRKELRDARRRSGRHSVG